MKVIRTILIFALVFVLTSCVSPNSGAPKIKEVDFSKIEKIEVTWSGYPVLLSDEQTAYVISLWQNGEWMPGRWKISPDYDIKAGEFAFYYDLDNGIFVGKNTDISLLISDEQIEVLKSYLATVSADAIAEITVGMTLSQVASILMSPGTPDSEFGGYRYFCDDGSEYVICLVYDNEIYAPVVTGITKIDTEA